MLIHNELFGEFHERIRNIRESPELIDKFMQAIVCRFNVELFEAKRKEPLRKHS